MSGSLPASPLLPGPSVLARLLRLIGPYRWWIAAGAGLGFLAIGSSVALMAVSAYLISRAAIITNVADVALAITTVRVLAISRAAFRYIERYATHRATLRILASLRTWFYAAVEPLAPARLGIHRSGDLLARIVDDVDSLEAFYVRAAVPPVVAALVMAFATLLLGAFSPALGVVLLVFLALTGVGLPLVSRRLTRQPAGAVVAARADLGATLVDGVQGVADLLALDQAGRHRERALALGRRLDREQERLAVLRGTSNGLAALLTSLAAICLLGIAIPLVDGGTLDGVYLALVPLAAIASFEAVQPLSQAMEQLDASRAAAERLFEIIDAPPEVGDPVLPCRRPTGHGLEIRGLRFGYEPDGPLVLDGLDLSIAAGGCLGLVGPSGAGKSTIVNLLLRFWDYREGEIRIGGTNVRDLAADDVRSMIGVVSQRVDLFDSTLRDNLAIADPDLTDERMAWAFRVVGLDDLVASLPAGYATRVGEHGVRLSGGERQRLAIARVILRDAPILVLDEATANLDALSEQRLLDSLAGFMAGRTTLLISHRQAVLARADRVMTLDGIGAGPARRAA